MADVYDRTHESAMSRGNEDPEAGQQKFVLEKEHKPKKATPSSPRPAAASRSLSSRIVDVLPGSHVPNHPARHHSYGAHSGSASLSSRPASSRSDASVAEGMTREAKGSDTKAPKKSSWLHITILLISEYVGYVSLCMPWIYSKMGAGLAAAGLVLHMLMYIASSLVLWKFVLHHPHVRDAVEIVAYMIEGKPKWFKVFKSITSVYFYSITLAIMAFHIVSGAEYIETVTPNWLFSCKNIAVSVIAILPCFFLSLVRSFSLLSELSVLAGGSTYVGLIVLCVLLGQQSSPQGSMPYQGEPIVSAPPGQGSSFVDFIVAFLTAGFATNASVTIPTFVNDMEDPRQFPKALFLSSGVVLTTFAVFGGVIYGFTGDQYMTNPALGSLTKTHKIIVFSLMIPTIVFLGSLYAAVLARRANKRLVEWSKKRYPEAARSRVMDWTRWVATLAAVWVTAWLIANLVPFFSGLTSIVAAVFVSFFGFVLPPFAWFWMRSAEDARLNRKPWSSWKDCLLRSFWIFMFVFGFAIMLVVGVYASIVNLLDQFKHTGIGSPFACKSD
ncbi:transmembrane amino acid transporter protein [Sarocladium implicatum]|nr:transmembrane amino acid transporter protein [Sarocladium implicatum]